jgi:subtilase family serine protease
MRARQLLLGSLGVAALTLAALVSALTAEGASATFNYRRVCPTPPIGYAHCISDVVVRPDGVYASSTPWGLSPATIESAYKFSSDLTVGGGETVAIVDAYDDPTIESDLAVFDSQYGLPACTSTNGCFTKVDQTGGLSYPRSDGGWALEISLDVEWAHAIAPGAKILLVEASSSSFANLLTAEQYAAAHADYVSNSWGGSEFSGESSYDSSFTTPAGKATPTSFFVASGDSGLPAEYPSASPNVISVGGTTLNFYRNTGTLVSETGWSGSGGGCSAYETANSAQSSFSQYGQVSCGGMRATPDVSLDADPKSGVSVYDTTRYLGSQGWWKVGGTSASTPMWAARSADAGATVDAGYVYGGSITYRDITSGSNGASCLTGYDLVTGRGSWMGSTP